MASENLKVEKAVQTPNSRNQKLTGSSLSREITSGSGRSISARAPDEPPLLGWPIKKATLPRRSISDAPKPPTPFNSDLKKHHYSNISEMEMMKERFAKLLLGEDMSGSGKGVCTALAISNAITNLCATIFGQLWRLEPLPMEKKSMWKREMEWLISVTDHIVHLIPSSQNFADGTKLEVMTCKPRSDIFINLPALRKLDNLLLDIVDSFKGTEFWYVDQGIECDAGSTSFRKTLQRQEDKWWLPVPRVPPGGLRESSRKQLEHRRECTNQILKAAVAINTTVLAEMDVPDTFYDTLPKNGRACLGDMIYRYITSDRFSPECLLDCLDLSSEHLALEIANRVESAIYVWRRRVSQVTNPSRSTTKSSWEMVKDLMVDGDKREVLAERAERLLLTLKQRCPGLTQTTLDTSKIQCNKDVGKSILESYSRVLESLAFNIVARIDDVLYVDDLTKCGADQLSTTDGPTISVITHRKIPDTMPFASVATPHRQCIVPPSLANSSTKQQQGIVAPSVARDSGKPPRRSGPGVRRVLTNYLAAESKAKTMDGNASPRIDKENADPQKT